MRKKLVLLFIVLVFSSSASVMALTIGFTGNVYSVGLGISGDGVSVGDIITGQFTYDAAVLDPICDTDYGSYYEAQKFDIMFSSGFFYSSLSTTAGVQNDRQNGWATLPADGMTVRSDIASGDTLNGKNVTAFQFGLRRENISGHLWSDEYLPDADDWAGVSLADINAPDWHWMEFDHMLDSQIRWEITSFTVSPEPGTMVLLGIGLAGLAGIRRRKQHSAGSPCN